jgi:hypothetical protein
MSKTNHRATTNHSDHKTRTVIPLHHDLVLTGAQARTLWEICTLVTYSDGFTYSPEQEALCAFIADSAGSSASDRAFCLARAEQRERAEIARYCERRAAA